MKISEITFKNVRALPDVERRLTDGVKNPEALMAEWRARLAADPAMAGRWSAAYAQHYARLRTERAAGR